MKVEKLEQDNKDETAPPEYLIEGATSIPVVRERAGNKKFSEVIRNEIKKLN